MDAARAPWAASAVVRRDAMAKSMILVLIMKPGGIERKNARIYEILKERGCRLDKVR